jgi:hypothetical protein
MPDPMIQLAPFQVETGNDFEDPDFLLQLSDLLLLAAVVRG